jgi:pterin-4a-carbinolamine dehydratase
MEHSNHWIANDGTIKILNDFKVKSFSEAFSVHRCTEDETISEQHEDHIGICKIYRVY